MKKIVSMLLLVIILCSCNNGTSSELLQANFQMNNISTLTDLQVDNITELLHNAEEESEIHLSDYGIGEQDILIPDILVHTDNIDDIDIVCLEENSPSVFFIPLKSIYTEEIEIKDYRLSIFAIYYNKDISPINNLSEQTESLPETASLKKYTFDKKDVYIKSMPSETENALIFIMAYTPAKNISCLVVGRILNQTVLTDDLAEQMYNDFSCTLLASY